MKSTTSECVSTQFPEEGDVNFLELCNEDPVLANNIIKNITKMRFCDLKRAIKIPSIIPNVSLITSKHINQLVYISGSIIKVYPITYQKVSGELSCLKCNEIDELEEYDLESKVSPICHSCGSTYVKVKEIFREAIPIQKIRIQDIQHFSAISETVEILLEEEMVDQYRPGEKISVIGIVNRKWKPLKKNEEIISTLFIKAVDVKTQEINEDNYNLAELMVAEFKEKNNFQKRQFLLEIIDDDVFELEHVKLSLLILLTSRTNLSKTRKSCHMLVVGDPGTGKTRLLKLAIKLLNPAIYTNGVATTDAGLTSCAVRQGKEWILEAGALVMADNGVCCIDEFNKLKMSDKGGLLESMEQQTLSVAKAGIVTTLSTRCSILAAATSRYNYSLDKPVSENLGLTTPLVSRFDLIFGIFDKKNDEKDGVKVDKVFKKVRSNQKKNEDGNSKRKLKSFISLCREKSNILDSQKSEILINYYNAKRKIDGPNEFNTIRMLESLVRLAEAHSNLLMKDCVEIEDVYIAIILQELSLNSSIQLKIDYSKIFTNETYFNQVKSELNNKYNLEC